jgi:hypothetical protein
MRTHLSHVLHFYIPNIEPLSKLIQAVTKAIGNNKEQKKKSQHGDTRFNVENPLQQREVKTTGASQQNFTISGVCLQTPWVIL